jgi:hypothetical protein
MVLVAYPFESFSIEPAAHAFVSLSRDIVTANQVIQTLKLKSETPNKSQYLDGHHVSGQVIQILGVGK